MSVVLPRAIAVIEALTAEPRGLALADIAEKIDAPKSATHRVLTELTAMGYLHQEEGSGHYALGLSLVSQALRHLAAIPLVELARPELDNLAVVSGELARLGLPDHGTVVWVAKSQGARSGLRFDPDDGRVAKLARTSTGVAWLSTLPRTEAIEHLTRQGFEDLANYGPEGASNLDEAVALVEKAQEDGYCYTDSVFELGTATIAVPVRKADQRASAVLSIAGPSVRLTRAHATSLVPPMMEAAQRLLYLTDRPIQAVS